jgi:hypothetical protein
VVVTTADKRPGGTVDQDFFNPAMNQAADGSGSNAGSDGGFRPYDGSATGRMQEWMEDALPTLSHDFPQPDFTRLRYESAPPDFLGVFSITQVPERDWRRGDQLMLTSSNFVPRCTEFIVEWSFGKTYPNPPQKGELIWHGMDRKADQGGTQVTLAVAYDDTVNEHKYETVVPLRDGTTTPHTASTKLIHGGTLPNPQDKPITSYFGYLDPTFNPDMDGPMPGVAGSTGGDLNPDGRLESDKDATVTTVAWPWPRFIRITLSVADPGNPSVERTFQFVFDVPQEGAR